MSPAGVFELAFPLAVPFWLLMIVAPWWSVTRRIVASPLIAVPPLLVYLVGLLPQLGPFWAAVSAPSLVGITALFGTPAGAATAWAHFIGFDLFIGRWMFLDSRERGITAWAVSPILLLTVFLSPLGLLTYLLLRTVRSALGPAHPPTAGRGRTEDQHSPGPGSASRR